MRLKSRHIFLPLLLWFFLSINTVHIQAEEAKPIFKGVVTDRLTGAPIPNSTVVIWDLTDHIYERITTNSTGMYSATVTRGHTLRIYVYSDDPGTLGFDYVPVKSHDIQVERFATQQEYNLSFTLHPGASVALEGQIYYVKSSAFPSRYTVRVIDPATEEPPALSPPSANFTEVFEWGVASNDLWYLKSADLSRFNQSVTVVPAGIPVDLKVETHVWIKPRPYLPGYVEFIQLAVDNNTLHYALSQGTLATSDLGWYSLLMSTRVVETFYDLTWKKLVEMEGAGFYMGRVKEDMDEARWNIDDAETLRAQGNYEESLLALATAYTTVTVMVAVSMDNMWLTAQSSAVVMPLFPALFGVTMAFFLFEKLRRKIVSSCILYGASFVVLYYVYPGFQIVDVTFLLALAFSSLVLALFIAFGAPRLIKEPDIPGPFPFRAVLSVVFSMGKRNVKRRLSRGVLTIASLTVLVLAFTTFTSFGRALGLLTTSIDTKPLTEGILIKNLPPPWVKDSTAPYLPISTDDVEWLTELREVTLVSPLVWSNPLSQPLGVLRGVQNKELTIFGVLGVDPSSEANVTRIDQAIKSGILSDLENPYGAMISQEAANQIGASQGDTLPFYVSTTGGSQFHRNLTIVGIIEDEELSNLIDFDGNPLLPFKKIVEDEKIVYVRADTSGVLVLNWEAALEIPGEITAISRIAVQIGSPENSDSFARQIVWTKEYNVWVSLNDKVTWYLFGEFLEMGGFTLLVPLVIVLLNVGLVMISIVSERTSEIFTLTCVGFNPTHIAALFLAESVVMGLVGGGLGYLLGMSSYRLMTFLAVDIAVRQKLEWYWGVIGVLLAVLVAVLSAVRPASRAVMSVTPSLVKKIKLPEKERIEREEEVWKIYQAQIISMPVKVHEKEELFFSSYLSTRMEELRAGLLERVSDYSETEEETPEGDRVKHFAFTYSFTEETGPELVSINELVATKKSGQDHYLLRLIAKPKTPGLPGTWLDRTTRFVRDILGDWEEEKSAIMGRA